MCGSGVVVVDMTCSERGGRLMRLGCWVHNMWGGGGKEAEVGIVGIGIERSFNTRLVVVVVVEGE